MIIPDVELQAGIVGALKADAPLATMVGDRVFDRVPGKVEPGRPPLPAPPFPYVNLGAFDTVDAGDDCHDAASTSVEVHVWSRAVGAVEAKLIAARVARVLDAEIAVQGFAVQIHEIESVRTFPDPDGLTTHSLVTVRYETAPTA